MEILVLFLLLWIAALYLPFAMRTWRGFLVLCGVYLLIGVGVRIGVAIFSANEVPKFLVILGDFWLDFLVPHLPVPVIARAVVLAAKSLGLGGKRLIALNVVGILALPGSLLGIVAYDRWDRRPAPVVCTARPIPLSLAGADGSVPWSSAIHFYLGPDIRVDGRYLFSPGHRRSICRDTSNGAEPLAVTALTVELWRLPPDRCTAPDSQPWEQMLCQASEEGTLLNLPHEIAFFDPNGLRLGDYGISSLATDEGYPLTEVDRLVSAENTELGSVQAVCRTQLSGTGSTLCRMRRQISDGIGMYWDLYAPPGDVEDRLLQAESVASSICASVFDLPGCTLMAEVVP